MAFKKKQKRGWEMKVNGITGLCFKILGFEVFVKNHQIYLKEKRRKNDKKRGKNIKTN